MADAAIPPFKEFAVGVSHRAGTILMRNFSEQQKIIINEKNRRELVTSTDKEVHEFIEFKIQQQFPDHNFLSEEGERIEQGSPFTWVADPLDGTLNYTIANPFFSTSLTLMQDSLPNIGVIYAPFMQEMFVAGKGGTCRLNERDVAVSRETNLVKGVLSFSYFCRDSHSRNVAMQAWNTFEDCSRAMRHLGCTSLELAYVACGRMEAVIISPPLRLWDVAAGILMVEAAGGTVTNFAGTAWNGIEEGLVASNGRVHEAVLALLQKSKL